MPSIDLLLVGIQPDTQYTEKRYQTPDCRQLLEIYAAYYPEIGFYPPWIGYFIEQDSQVVGSCGFTGPPCSGEVEVAYWTFPEYRRKGVAAAACKALLMIVRQFDPTLLVVAKTAPEENTSTRILRKYGFVRAGIVLDDEIGEAWRWELGARPQVQKRI